MINNSIIPINNLEFVDPYTNATGFCNIVETAMHTHYQGLLNSYSALFFFGGLVLGLAIMTIIWLLKAKK